MKIRIIAGVYGYRDQNGFLKPKGEGEVIDIDDTESERLIGLGVASSVEPVASQDSIPDVLDDSEGDTTPDESEAEEEAASEATDDEYVDYNDMSFEELKESAELLGIDTSKLRSKKAVIKAIEDLSTEA